MVVDEPVHKQLIIDDLFMVDFWQYQEARTERTGMC